MKTYEEFKKQIVLNHTVENTRTAYLKPVRLFLEHSKGVVTQDSIDFYLLKLREENKKRSTYNQTLIALSKYINFCEADINLPKAETIKKKNKEYITSEQLENDIIPMLSLICRDHQKYELILRVLFFTGLRISEFTNLKRKDISFDRECFTINESKSEPRIIPFLNKKMVGQIKDYFKYYEEKQNAFNVSNAQVTYMTKKIEEELNLDINFTPHVLRASFAKHLNRNKCSAFRLQYLMGHTDIKQTEKYVQVDEKDIMDFGKDFMENKNEN